MKYITILDKVYPILISKWMRIILLVYLDTFFSCSKSKSLTLGEFKFIDYLCIASWETASNFGCCQSHCLCVCVCARVFGWVWGGRWWQVGTDVRDQAAIKGEKTKWHLTLLDAGEWRAATEVQSSWRTFGNREERARDQVRRALMWGREDGPGNLTLASLQ